MDWGSVLGHGTYLGPDFTAETLHRRVELIRDHLARERHGRGWAELDEAHEGLARAGDHPRDQGEPVRSPRTIA